MYGIVQYSIDQCAPIDYAHTVWSFHLWTGQIKEGHKVFSQKKDDLSSFFLFCLNTTLRNQHPVKSKIWQSHPWSQSCPDFLLSRHYTPVNRNLQAVRNVRFCKHFWWQMQRTSRRICKICMKLWNFVPKCINFRTASSCLIKISPYFNSQPD